MYMVYTRFVCVRAYCIYIYIYIYIYLCACVRACVRALKMSALKNIKNAIYFDNMPVYVDRLI